MKPFYIVTVKESEENTISSIKVFEEKANAVKFAMECISKEAKEFSNDNEFANNIFDFPMKCVTIDGDIFDDPTEAEDASAVYGIWNPNLGGEIYDNDDCMVFDVTINRVAEFDD